MKTKYSWFLIIFCLFLAGSALAQTSIPIPSGRPIQVTEILDIAESIGGFLRVLGGILVSIVIIISGFMYFLSGSNQTRVKAAKDILKAGVIGGLIIFSVGIIIGTISGFTTDPFQFFGGGGGGGQAYGCSCVNNFLTCVPMNGGAYSDPACYGSCPGTVGC